MIVRLGGYLLGILTGCWVISSPVLAQPVALPTLKQQITAARTDTARSRLLCELGYQYIGENLDSSFVFFGQALQLARRGHDSFGQARAMYHLGFTHLYYTKDEASALQWLSALLKVTKAGNDNQHLAHYYRLMGVAAFHQHMGNSDALLAKSIDYARKSGNWRVLADTYGTRYDLAVAAGQTDFAFLASTIQNAMAASQPYDTDAWVTFGLDYCSLLDKNGKPEETLALARQLAAQTSKLKKNYGEFVYTCNQGRLLIILKKYDEAEQVLRAGVATENRRPKPDSLHLYHYYRTLIDAYKQQNAWQKAYQTRDTMARLQLWLQTVRQTRDAKLRITQQLARLDKEKHAAEIAVLTVRQQKQQLLLLSAALIALLLAGFVWTLWRTRQRIERQRTLLAQLNTNLTDVNATKDKLFAILSHDLRGPIDNLRGYLTLHNWGALRPDEFDASARSLGERLNYLQTMLDNVLNWALSQMNGMQAQMNTSAVAPVIDHELTLLKPIAEAKGIELTSQIPTEAQLWIDKNHLAIIIRNLLQNALKFTPAGGAVCIGYSQTRTHQTIDVTDTGIGMSEVILADTFRITPNSRPGTANEPGTGLGLVLVKELVMANGGQITVVSEEGRGTTFWLTFAVTKNTPFVVSSRSGTPVSETVA